MKKIIGVPQRYIQGPGILEEIGSLVRPWGTRAVVYWDSFVKSLLEENVVSALQNAGIEVSSVLFPGEATQNARKLLAEEAKGKDMILAFGGGKTLDTAKGACLDADTAMISCPTIASTDSPASACAVWYDEEGNYEGFEMMPFNPNAVIVDTEVLVNAPVKTFTAGMGDALATWVEAETVRRSRTLNFLGGHCTEAALAWAKLSFDILMEYGLDAQRDVKNHLVTPAVEKVTEANILLSGIGFESVGLASAHDIGNFLSNYHECHAKGMMHGHKVAFGLLAQLCLDENAAPDFRRKVLDFLVAAGLPVTLEELGFPSPTPEQFYPLADFCAAKGSLSSSHSFPLSRRKVLDAIFAADALGKEALK
ncbi:MAG: glycerol dehydrogenase [Planctomycetia bacterium]|nr:glycerol dehydrogenase [Planctomycetia bacterium]